MGAAARWHGHMALLILAVASPAWAQGASQPSGSEARIALRGSALVVTRPPEVVLREADITITPQELRGSYVFQNSSSRDIGAMVAFPAPDLDGASPDIGYTAIPAPEQLNFMEFSAVVDRAAVTPLEEHHAFGAGLDRTPLLEELNTPLPPTSVTAWRELGKLRPSSLVDLGAAGLIDMDRVGERLEPRPRWLLKTTWYWPQVFPAGKETIITWRHRVSTAVSTPLVGAIGNGPDAGRHGRYCGTAAAREVAQAALKNGAGNDWILERTVAQQISTGPAYVGPAGIFTVTIEAGDDGAIAATCFGGMAQIRPGVWRARRENVVVDEVLDVMFLSPGMVASQSVPPSEEDNGGAPPPRND